MRSLPPKGRRKRRGNWFKYEYSFMRKVVQDYLSGHQSVREVAERYNLTYGSVSGWVRRFGADIENENAKEEVALSSMPEEGNKEGFDELKKRNEELLKKLEHANLKVSGLEIMIDIAEQQLGVDIRKKSGTKQS
jgi:transposase-like protein